MIQISVKVLTTNNLRVLGNLKLSTSLDSYCSSVLEVLNNSRSFIELTNVEVYGNDQQLLTKMAFLCINKSAIAYLFEE